MVVEFFIEPKFMKDNLASSIYLQELKAFKKEIKDGKVFVESVDNGVLVTITDAKLEKEFIDGFSKTRERMSMKILERMCKLKVMKDDKEIKLW